MVSKSDFAHVDQARHEKTPGVGAVLDGVCSGRAPLNDNVSCVDADEAPVLSISNW